MSTQTLPRADLGPPELAEGPKTHIVKRAPGDPRTAAAIVMEARINGTPVEALCGHVWVPSRDPKSHPLCQLCKDIWDLHGDLGDAPKGMDPLGLPS